MKIINEKGLIRLEKETQSEQPALSDELSRLEAGPLKLEDLQGVLTRLIGRVIELEARL
jgi:hypothetical protein